MATTAIAPMWSLLRVAGDVTHKQEEKINGKSKSQQKLKFQ